MFDFRFSCRRQIQEINWQRKSSQTHAGEQLRLLESSWVGLVSKNYEIERACLHMEARVGEKDAERARAEAMAVDQVPIEEILERQHPKYVPSPPKQHRTQDSDEERDSDNGNEEEDEYHSRYQNEEQDSSSQQPPQEINHSPPPERMEEEEDSKSGDDNDDDDEDDDDDDEDEIGPQPSN